MRSMRLTLVMLLSLAAVTALLSAITRPALARAPAASGTCAPDSVISSTGAVYRICMPGGTWNGDLVIYAHGYVPFNRPVAIPEEQLRLPNGTSLPELINSLGLAFATTSYRTNGLAVEHGVEDLVDVLNVFTATHGSPAHVYVTGVSEGGLLTALAIERRPDLFDGGLAACGPVGDFHRQLEYFGDFRVLFDYFFPGLLPGSPISIPQSLIDSWPAYYTATIRPAIFHPSNAGKLDQLLRVSRAPYIPGASATIELSILDALSYNVLGTNDAVAKLGGQPYSNQGRLYTGSNDDAHLNANVQRFGASGPALNRIDTLYQTTGQISAPLVTIHTTFDQQVPYWHEPQYRGKIILNDVVALHRHVEVARYGHCAFEAPEVLSAFLTMIDMVLNPPEISPSPRRYLPLVQRAP